MNTQEANARLKTEINEGQLNGITSLYLIMDLDKDTFCRIVDTVGIDKLLAKQRHYERLDKAEQELTAKEKYLSAKCRLEEIEIEKQRLKAVVSGYEKENAT